MTEEKVAWHKPLYSEEYNPAIRLFKRLCQWAIFNVPDASLLDGTARLIVNIIVVFLTAGVAFSAVLYARNPLELFIFLWMASWIPGIAFIRTVAMSIHKAIEVYSRLMEKAFRNI